MRIASLLFASLVAAGAASCGGSSTSPPATAPGPVASDDPPRPVAVAGTSVTVEDTDRGAALVFVTTGDVAEVRKRATAMAAMHNEHHAAMGPLPTGDEGGGGHDHGGHSGHDMGDMEMVHSQATVEEIDGGARIVLVAAPADVAQLQEQLRMHAQHMSGGTCAMGEH